MSRKINLCLPSELGQIKRAVQEILRFLELGAPSMSADDRFDLKLVFSELLANAVIHGNKSDSRKRVYLTAEIKDGAVYSTIMDEGPGFNYDSVVHGGLCDDIYDESGRGVRLACSLTDSFGYNKKGNRIYFHKKVKSK
ncbi:MAG: ATP-binding protein [Firmicutes bacterium]|nr:ATP-binding protein [Bacillota bacterium]